MVIRWVPWCAVGEAVVLREAAGLLLGLCHGNRCVRQRKNLGAGGAAGAMQLPVALQRSLRNCGVPGVHVRKYPEGKSGAACWNDMGKFRRGCRCRDVEVHGEYDVTWTSIKEVASAGVLGS